MHQTLKRQLERLGLDADKLPDAGLWRQLLECLSAAFHQADSSEARFRSLIGLSSDIYWEQDREYRFTSFSGTGTERINPANLQWIGRKRWEQNFTNMTAPDWAAHIAVLDARQPFRDLELCRLSDSGEEVWTMVSGEPIFDAAGAF